MRGRPAQAPVPNPWPSRPGPRAPGPAASWNGGVAGAEAAAGPSEADGDLRPRRDALAGRVRRTRTAPGRRARPGIAAAEQGAPRAEGCAPCSPQAWRPAPRAEGTGLPGGGGPARPARLPLGSRGRVSWLRGLRAWTKFACVRPSFREAVEIVGDRARDAGDGSGRCEVRGHRRDGRRPSWAASRPHFGRLAHEPTPRAPRPEDSAAARRELRPSGRLALGTASRVAPGRAPRLGLQVGPFAPRKGFCFYNRHFSVRCLEEYGG